MRVCCSFYYMCVLCFYWQAYVSNDSVLRSSVIAVIFFLLCFITNTFDLYPHEYRNILSSWCSFAFCFQFSHLKIDLIWRELLFVRANLVAWKIDATYEFRRFEHNKYIIGSTSYQCWNNYCREKRTAAVPLSCKHCTVCYFLLRRSIPSISSSFQSLFYRNALFWLSL